MTCDYDCTYGNIIICEYNVATTVVVTAVFVLKSSGNTLGQGIL